MWKATEIVRKPDRGRLPALTVAGAALHLQIKLIDHAQAGSPDRMAKAFEAAVDLAGEGSVSIVEAVKHVIYRRALLRDVQILHGDEFGHRKTVVDFDKVERLPRLFDAGFLISALGCDARGGRAAGTL